MSLTPDWVKHAVFYQIFPDRFARSPRMDAFRRSLHFEPWDAPPTVYGFKGGDLYGVAERLDYLQDLGVTALYLNPIFASAANHRYHTYDYYQVDPLLGGNAALRFLLDEAHARGMRIVLDGVFNHAGRGFWPFHHVLENGADSPYVDWFYFDPDRLHRRRPWGAYPHPEEEAALRRGEDSLTAIGYRSWWNLPALPKFNTQTPAVREFLLGVAEHWLRFGIDGWRLDVPAEIDDDAFWRAFRRRVKAVNPEAYIVGEIWHRADRWLQGDQFDAVMNYPVGEAALSFFGRESLNLDEIRKAGYGPRIAPIEGREFARRLEAICRWYHPEIVQAQLNLLDSHDTPRFLTAVSGDRRALKMAWLFLFTLPGAPCVYYGDEIGLTGGHDPACRGAFPWDESRWDADLRNFVQSLAALRRAYPPLRTGTLRVVYADSECVAYVRAQANVKLTVLFNTARRSRAIDLEEVNSPVLVFGSADVQTERGRTVVTLPPRTGAVLAG